MGSAGINSELEIKLDKCPISTVAVKFPIFARIWHTIYKHIYLYLFYLSWSPRLRTISSRLFMADML